ncbi:NIPSNAP family protein [uncultured Chitinophaga sp.]|uniref:NIPSNAP family protein n=1 Tax=uncultured Chitinophaga sp. TaxID=339340 RepID=UPI002608C04B|nr:NIPSNAP family protein [uncultured Chitinophaga sp.]
MKQLLLAAALLSSMFVRAASPEIYEIRIYHFKTMAQLQRVSDYLRTAHLPALHRQGIKAVGVFQPIVQDTADLRIYVFVPYKSFGHFSQLQVRLGRDAQLQAAGKDYIDAPHDQAPYARMETILLQAFSGMPVMELPKLTGPKSARVYELRSYESPTEKYYHNKVKMFNAGDEIGIFRKLNFNAVFYGEVLAGARMPNLMYLTTFVSQEDRDAHWKAFSADADWKKLSAEEEYKNNVSKNEKFFLRPMEYSDI